MPKIKISSKSFFVKLIITDLTVQLVCVLGFSAAISICAYFADIKMELVYNTAYLILAAAAFLSALFVAARVKSHGLLVGIFCQIPLMLYICISYFAQPQNAVHLLIKLAVLIVFGAVGGAVGINKKKKYKVK
ncbi:MAG: TIGR04086 family membrane protein [Clostridiales bacterium]|uniref:TIGR04086 family membrane protein n=1 Tax=Candidatus Scybalenecus merdavium TaxID=2840939 RepID=A0A9D1SN29_9FIRM|nr:TIGR04086 family membrane protein [Clostridiales bacterium]HIU68448.1 TIGR04086 family membrane protein [Candidatus Scubalenecus merdavium]